MVVLLCVCVLRCCGCAAQGKNDTNHFDDDGSKRGLGQVGGGGGGLKGRRKQMCS